MMIKHDGIALNPKTAALLHQAQWDNLLYLVYERLAAAGFSPHSEADEAQAAHDALPPGTWTYDPAREAFYTDGRLAAEVWPVRGLWCRLIKRWPGMLECIPHADQPAGPVARTHAAAVAHVSAELAACRALDLASLDDAPSEPARGDSPASCDTSASFNHDDAWLRMTRLVEAKQDIGVRQQVLDASRTALKSGATAIMAVGGRNALALGPYVAQLALDAEVRALDVERAALDEKLCQLVGR